MNKYGMMSGGYIFDAMDRFALSVLNQEHPETKSQIWVTARVDDMQFKKQLCRPIYELNQIHHFVDINKSWVFFVYAFDEYGDIVAKARIVFKQAKHNYCEIKGGNND